MLEKERDYSIKPENLNLDEYKNPLLNKLKDSLEIAGFDVAVLEPGLFEHNTISQLTMPSRGVAGNMISISNGCIRSEPSSQKKWIRR